jgi:hypothetical protein
MKSTLKTELTCKGCGATWKHTTGKTTAICPYCGKCKNARDRHEEAKRYDFDGKRKDSLKSWSLDPQNVRERGKRHRILLRKRMLFRITGSITPCCARCGCDDIRLLEINHKNGGGNRELEAGRTAPQFYYAIADGKRDPSDLEVLCRPCNALHYLELKYGHIPMHVVWEGNEESIATV